MYAAAGRRLSAARLARGVATRARLLLPHRPRPAILMYHRVARDRFDPWGLAVDPGRFAAQLEWLSTNRSIMALGEFAARHRNGDLPADALAVTFDDGYVCSATVAAPLLERFAVPATIFLPIELIERGEPFWWDELQDLVFGFEGGSLRVCGAPVAIGKRRDDDLDWSPGKPPRTERQAAFLRLWEMLRPLPAARLANEIGGLRVQAGCRTTTPDSKRPMTPSQVRAAASERISFGSHALTHPWLSSLASSEKAREILDSKERCEALTGSPSDSFAYPYGNFDEESRRLVERAGFGCACSTARSAVGARSSRFALPRVQVGNWDSRSLKRALGSLGPG